jgi:hypothetical protein
MNNPFPGMNPWLEHPALWSDVHFRLIAAIARYLSPLIAPRYYVSVGAQTYISTPLAHPPAVRYPDIAVIPISAPVPGLPGFQPAPALLVEPITVQVPVPDFVEEMYLEIYEIETRQVITVIEVLSPTNKRPGAGRQKYERKRLEILSTQTHLVEIDLLRDWAPMPFAGAAPRSHYRILVRRGEKGSTAELYPFNLPVAIPEFYLPLQPGDIEPRINLTDLVAQIYVEGNYAMRIDYCRPPKPPLTEDEAEWAKQLLAKKQSK